MTKNIFIVEDDPDVLSLLSHILNKNGYKTRTFTCGEDILKDIEVEKPDLILLDLILPGINGLEVCEKLKSDPDTWNIPIIILTTRSYEFDIVTGLNVGSDDYITKPFSEKVLLARIKTALRREERKDLNKNDIIKIKDLVIDPDRFQVSVKSKIINFTASEFKILHFLSSNKGVVFSRDQLFENIRGLESDYVNRSIDIMIGRIRKKIYSEYIESIYGIGYRFKEFKE